MSERRMDAYYYGFEPTNKDAINKILGAVACAGRAFHYTECWVDEISPYDDHTGETPCDWIQNAANEAAKEVERLEDEITRLRAELAHARKDAAEARDKALEKAAKRAERFDFTISKQTALSVAARKIAIRALDAVRAAKADTGWRDLPTPPP